MTTEDEAALPGEDAALETIEFTTPQTPEREVVRTSVDLCGEKFLARRPKDANLFFAQAAIADVANDADRALAMLQLIDAILEPVDRHRFLARVCARELTAGAVYDMIEQLLDRWSPETKIPAHAPVKVQPHPDTAPSNAPVHVVNADLNLDVVCHPPTDLVLQITASSIATGANMGQQAWCVMLFLDAALSTVDAGRLDQRIRNPRDELDLEALLSIIQALMERWYPEAASEQGNRQQRRARAATDKKKTTRKKGPAKTKAGPAQQAAVEDVGDMKVFSADEDG